MLEVVETSKAPDEFSDDTNLLVIGDIKPSHSFTLTSRAVFTALKRGGSFTKGIVNVFSPPKYGEKRGYSTHLKIEDKMR